MWGWLCNRADKFSVFNGIPECEWVGLCFLSIFYTFSRVLFFYLLVLSYSDLLFVCLFVYLRLKSLFVLVSDRERVDADVSVGAELGGVERRESSWCIPLIPGIQISVSSRPAGLHSQLLDIQGYREKREEQKNKKKRKKNLVFNFLYAFGMYHKEMWVLMVLEMSLQ